jgi:hypothetical protein
VSASARAWFAAAAVTAATGGLVAADSLDASLRDWWGQHAFTTSTVTGLLVLLVTVLVADRVIERRRTKDRSRAVAAQASIVLGQGVRACDAVRAWLDADPDAGQDAEDAAGDETRTYTMAVMIAAPILIDAAATREFLETSQALGAQLTLALSHRRKGTDTAEVVQRIAATLTRLRTLTQPLAKSLSPRLQAAITGQDASDEAPVQAS